MLCFLQYRLSSYRRIGSPAKKTAEEREDTDYEPGTSGSEAGTPKKGRKKKETPDPGLTLGTDIEDHLKPDGRQVEVELHNVRIDQEKTKGQSRRKDTNLLQKRIESLEGAPPTGPLHVVLWEDNSMLPTNFSLFSLLEPSRKDVSHICRWSLLVCIWTAQRGSDCEDSGEATYSVSGSAAVAYSMHRRYSEAYDTWAFRAKLAGQAQGSAQDVEPVPLYEAADNLIRCVEDQRRLGLADTYSNLKIAIVDAVQMSALVPTAELKQPGQFVCSLIVVSVLSIAPGLAHNVVTFRTKRINCGKDFMTFAYYAGPEAVKALQKFHDKGEKVTKNALNKLDGILLPEFYNKVAEVMQEEKTTLKSLQNSFDDIILEQWVSMHLDHRTTASTFDLRKVCTIDETWVPFLHRCAALSPFLFFSQRHADLQRGCCTWKACPEGDSWYMGLLAGT